MVPKKCALLLMILLTQVTSTGVMSKPLADDFEFGISSDAGRIRVILGSRFVEIC